jgi:hypothetical protein
MKDTIHGRTYNRHCIKSGKRETPRFPRFITHWGKLCERESIFQEFLTVQTKCPFRRYT